MSDMDYTLLGRIGAYKMHSLYDARETTRAARAAFLGRFEREVDPEGTLDPAERAVRAAAARRAYMLERIEHGRAVRVGPPQFGHQLVVRRVPTGHRIANELLQALLLSRVVGPREETREYRRLRLGKRSGCEPEEERFLAFPATPPAP